MIDGEGKDFHDVRMWYYSQNNQQLGPVSEDQLKSMLRGASLPSSSLVWKEGMTDWKPVSEIPELSIAVTVSAPSVYGSTTSAYTPPSSNPYASPQSQPARSYAPQSPMGPSINSGGILAFAIVVTVMCCLPFGVVGIVYASQINSKLAVGDYLGAAEAAQKSKMWSWIGFGSIAILFVFAFFAGMLEEIAK